MLDMSAPGDRYTVQLRTVHVVLREPPAQEVTQPEHAVPLIRAILGQLDQDQEHFLVLGLDVKCQPVGYRVVASGGIDFAAVDPRLVLRAVLLLGATQFLVAHNHPSGNPEPSREDVALSRRLARAAEVVELRLLDSLIVCQDRWVSLRDRGLL